MSCTGTFTWGFMLAERFRMTEITVLKVIFIIVHNKTMRILPMGTVVDIVTVTFSTAIALMIPIDIGMIGTTIGANFAQGKYDNSYTMVVPHTTVAVTHITMVIYTIAVIHVTVETPVTMDIWIVNLTGMAAISMTISEWMTIIITRMVKTETMDGSSEVYPTINISRKEQ